MKELTVGELKKALEGVPDELPVKLSSDSGVDQGMGEIIIESAKYIHYIHGEQVTAYFDIYANDHESEDE
jgi:hypothetical protein